MAKNIKITATNVELFNKIKERFETFPEKIQMQIDAAEMSSNGDGRYIIGMILSGNKLTLPSGLERIINDNDSTIFNYFGKYHFIYPKKEHYTKLEELEINFIDV